MAFFAQCFYLLTDLNFLAPRHKYHYWDLYLNFIITADDIWKWTAMQFHFSQLISINGFNDLKDKVGTILINEMMLFLISQITMSISGKAKIVVIHDGPCLLIMFTEPSQFSCEL